MRSTVKCPGCYGKVVVESEWSGRKIACPHCRGGFLVQYPSGKAPPEVDVRPGRWTLKSRLIAYAVFVVAVPPILAVFCCLGGWIGDGSSIVGGGGSGQVVTGDANPPADGRFALQIGLGLVVGLGLAASSGFRVFVPMLAISIATRAGVLQVDDGWQWISSWPAIAAFAFATLIEVILWCIPWMDNLLDTLATPAAIVTGIACMAACVSEMHPFLMWATAIIGGGGVAGTVQFGTVATRGTSSVTTGGFGNILVSMGELALAVLLAAVAVLAPCFAGLLVTLVLAVMGVVIFKWWRRREERKRWQMIALPLPSK